jgi:hypothetical protein
VKQVGYQIIIFYHLSPTSGWTNGGGESHLRHHVEDCFEEEFKNMGRMFSSMEFAYNRAIHSTTKVSPFQVVYSFKPRASIDILPLSTSERIHSDAKEHADFILKMHEQLSTTLKR